MTSWQERFRSCGTGVSIADDIEIDHPEMFDVGDGVKIGKGFTAVGRITAALGAGTTIFPGAFIQGSGTLDVGAGVSFLPNTYISVGGPDGMVRIGSGTHLAVGCAVYGGGKVSVERDCNVAAHVVISSIQHDPHRLGVPMSRAPVSTAPIVIDDDVWIGANASVLQGTHLAEGAIIGANAVVIRDVEAYSVYAGVPAVFVKVRQPPPQVTNETHRAGGS